MIEFCFNPRAREGRDRQQWKAEGKELCFNPRAREGRDLLASAQVLLALEFQSTRP